MDYIRSKVPDVPGSLIVGTCLEPQLIRLSQTTSSVLSTKSFLACTVSRLSRNRDYFRTQLTKPTPLLSIHIVLS